MSKLKIRLTRNLRRSLLQGHPWVYREAITAVSGVTQATLAEVSDGKGFIGWAIYDPHSPLALRVLSTDEVPPTAANRFFEKQFSQAYELRRGQFSESGASATNAFRLFNGEGDRLPGLVCDLYDQTAVLQFDGKGPSEFWDRDLIANWLLETVKVKSVVEKIRRPGADVEPLILIKGEKPKDIIQILENGARFEVNIAKGQKTGFFLDQRDNRFYVRGFSKGKTVLNLFSYTGGFSISAGLGGASSVTSVDLSSDAIASANAGFEANGLEKSRHNGIAADVFEFLVNEKEKWDHVIVDPPSMSHSEDRKDIAVKKYTELFRQCMSRVKRNGQISLSSCSSHISFEDFEAITTESLSLARRKGQVLRISGQGADHPYPHACPELRYLKFFHLVLD
ncbi:MAG: class I SAM-dependent rRNA methyltransferase [Bdellovibrionales bacterium]|nr:class I SAM-dependent rRNA methyltransferase [Bdellovibrionales bacterium]